MKFLYSKFTRAFAEVLLVIFIIVIFIGIIAFDQLYTNDIIDGEYSFKNTWDARRIAAHYADHLESEMNRILLQMQENKNKEQKDTDVSDRENAQENKDYLIPSGYNIYTDDEDYDIFSNLTINDFRDDAFIHKVLEHEAEENVNYHFVVRTRDEVLFTDIEDMQEVDYVNYRIGWYTYDDSIQIYIENYINKNIVKGDEFYRYNFFQDKFVTYFKDIVILLIISAVMAIVLGIYIIVMAGYKEDGTLGLDWMDYIPFELIVLLIGIVSSGIAETTYYSGGYMQIIFVAVGACLWVWIGINLIKTFISRLKNRVFLKKSIIGMLVLFTIKLLKQVFLDINTKMNAALSIGLIMFCEAILVFMTFISEGGLILLWILGKIGQFALLMYLYSMLLKLRNAAKAIHDGETEVKINTSDMYGIIGESADYMNDIFAGLDKAVAEKLKSEQLKTELITNVSHDIKTPLTSIINYIDLMKKEKIDNPKVIEYIDIVDRQSLRLKKLTEDVIEASKAATGNITAELTKINVSEMIEQALGEYESKFGAINLSVIYENGDIAHYASADGRLLWRVIDNLFSNVCKYTLEGTRLYIRIEEADENVIITMKNISKYQLNISSEELMQRFVRGDSSRSTNGNGLGLSIAESLTKLQGGSLKLDINGDLFMVSIFLVKVDAEVTELKGTEDEKEAKDFTIQKEE